MGIPKVVREMEFPQLGFFFFKFFKFPNWFEIGLKIAKIGIFSGVCQSLKCVKFGMSKKFLEKLKNGGFHLSFDEKTMKNAFFSVFDQK